MAIIGLQSISSYTQGLCTVTSVSSINPQLIITPDTTICKGTSRQLRTQPAGSFCWSPTTYLSDPLSANPLISATADITYYFTAQVQGTNIISNGNFSSGNSGFTSGYNFASPNTTESEYTVGSDPHAWNSSLPGCVDHTTASGNMMMINGSPVADVEVWKQTVPVFPNTNYSFSTWIQTLFHQNPAILRFSINGQEIGNNINASSSTCTWNQFATTWNSGSNTSAVISIVNKNTFIAGNDFALDDISFVPLLIQRDSVIIHVQSANVKTIDDTAICVNGTVQLQATGAQTYSWTPAIGLSDPNIANPVATLTGTTKFMVSGTTSNGCIGQDSVTIVTEAKPTVTVSPDTVVCMNTPVPLQATGGDRYVWSPATGLDDPFSPSPTAMITRNTVFKVTVSNDHCSAEDSVLLNLHPYPVFSAISGQTICNGATIILNASGGDNYLWSPATSLDNPAIASPSATPGSTTEYGVHISENTCGVDTTINVKIEVTNEPATASIPNAFTPNGDGKNDCFGIRKLDNASVGQFAVYNRWGQVVFETKDPLKCWDGTFKGIPQDAGGYAYVIRVNASCGFINKSGIVTLIR